MVSVTAHSHVDKERLWAALHLDILYERWLTHMGAAPPLPVSLCGTVLRPWACVCVRQSVGEGDIWALTLPAVQPFQPLGLQGSPIKMTVFSNDNVMLVWERKRRLQRSKCMIQKGPGNFTRLCLEPVSFHQSVSKFSYYRCDSSEPITFN